jgi:fructoselysine 6-kinase
MFTDIKHNMDNPVVHRIIAYAAFDGSPKGIAKTVQKYQSNPELHFYAWIESGEVLGICGFEVHDNKVEIHLIAVDEATRGHGIGSAMVTALQEKYNKDIEAETDDDAVVFYRKRGFKTIEFMHEKHGKRHTCLLRAMKKILSLSCCCVDVFPQKGTAEAGGNSLNVAASCAISNKADVFLMGSIGTDPHAAAIKNKAAKYKINCDKLYEIEGESASNSIYLTSDGDRLISDDNWINGVYIDFRIRAEDEAFVQGCDAVATTCRDPALPQLLKLRLKSDFLLSVDFMERELSEEWRDMFPAIDLFFISGKPEYLPLLKQWSLEFATVFIATLGGNGSAAYKDGEEYICEAIKVAEVVDTTGCGDSYQGAFIVDYLHGGDIKSAMRAGSESAAKTLSFIGAC